MPRRCLLLLIVPAFLILPNGRTQQPAKPAGGTVRDWGAKADGSDDWRAIQNAVDAGGHIHFPSGTYHVSRPIVVELARVGPVAVTGSAARVVMAGEGPAFKFVGTHAGTAAPETVKDDVWDRQRRPAIDGIEIQGGHERATGIEATGTMQLTITRVHIRKCSHGIHLTGRNRNVTIADSHVYHNTGIGVFLDKVNLHQINVTGSHVSYNAGGGIACVGGEVRNLQIAGCDLEANHSRTGPPTANVLIDSTGGTNAEVAITGNTIQHTRNAPGSANVRVKGPTTPSKGIDERRDGHVTISGNVLSDTAVNVHLDHARGVVITGNTFWTGLEYNLLAEHSTAVVVGANNLDRNPRYFREEDKATDAVLFRDCTDCTVTGLQLKGARHAPAGLALERCDRVSVTGVSVLDCDGVGVWLKDVTRSRVTGCLIRDDRPGATSVSMRTAGGSENLIADNVLGRPHEIQRGVGAVERNYEPWRK
ncbi:MAG TPA: right-handed parallel beta-helix repeat-containing protein [Gemmataceae bacterium]|nr:right-handed parallel beta-helix repeat-containing protein [Gemmataceae bacterium]